MPFEREARLYGSNFGAVEVDWLLFRARVRMSGASVSQLESRLWIVVQQKGGSLKPKKAKFCHLSKRRPAAERDSGCSFPVTRCVEQASLKRSFLSEERSARVPLAALRGGRSARQPR